MHNGQVYIQIPMLKTQNRIYIPPLAQLMCFHEMKGSIYHFDPVVVMTYRTLDTLMPSLFVEPGVLNVVVGSDNVGLRQGISERIFRLTFSELEPPSKADRRRSSAWVSDFCRSCSFQQFYGFEPVARARIKSKSTTQP